MAEELTDVSIHGEFAHGEPLRISGAEVQIPRAAIADHELVYRVRRASPGVSRGDLLIIEPREHAATGELVVAFRGTNVFIGRWWAKHGLRELRPDGAEPVTGELQIIGAVNLIVRLR